MPAEEEKDVESRKKLVKGKKYTPRVDYPQNNVYIYSSEWPSRGCRLHPGCQVKRN
jgi:hypothetical protein